MFTEVKRKKSFLYIVITTIIIICDSWTKIAEVPLLPHDHVM